MSEEKKFLPTFQIYYNKDLSKLWFVYYYDQQGRRVKKYTGINKHSTFGARMQAAKDLIKELKNQFGYYPRQDQTEVIRKNIYEFLERKKPIWRKKTYQSTKSQIVVLFEFLEKNKRQLTKSSMKAFFSFLSIHRHPTTYNTYFDKLKFVFKSVGHPGLIDEIEKVKAYRTPARYFQRHHIDQLANYMAANNPELWLFVKFIYYCFIRPGELRHLRAGDILLFEGKILVKGEISKNRKNQYVAIPDPFLPDLEFVRNLPAGSLLFPSPQNQNKPIGINTMSKRHREIIRALGYSSEYQLYSWKHTGAVELAKAGVGLKAIQLQLRHYSLDQTDEYLRQLGIDDFADLKVKFPAI